MKWIYRWHYIIEGNEGYTRGFSLWPRDWLCAGRARGSFETAEHVFLNIGPLSISWTVAGK